MLFSFVTALRTNKEFAANPKLPGAVLPEEVAQEPGPT
jgi:hypothetical protein